MRGGFAPRFALEAAFLVAVGVGAGLADLRPLVIVALLAGAWLLVSLVELAAYRAELRRLPAFWSYLPPPESGSKSMVEQGAVPEPDDTAYPLRADAGLSPSEEVEAYTRVLDLEPEPEREPEPEAAKEPAE